MITHKLLKQMNSTKHIDYVKVSQHLKEFYECDRILIDFHTLEGKIVIHKHSFVDGRIRMGQPTSYDYKDFESITERLKNKDEKL